MRFASLGSGSKGNATLVEHESTRLLIDNGFPLAETGRRLARLGLDADDLTAVLVTHEHSDHIRGVAALARRQRLPVWMTAGTRLACQDNVPDIRLFSAHEPFVIESLQISPFPVPHDAREPAQFVISDGQRRCGLLTDVGRITAHIESMLSGCHALILECNHDSSLLAEGAYPWSLKQRIAGNQGHLSNDQAAALLARLDCGQLQHIVAAHLSEQNNTAGHARAALSQALDCTEEWIAVCDQQNGLSWRAIS